MMGHLAAPVALGLWLATWILAVSTYLGWRRKLGHLQRDEQLGMSAARQKAVRLVSQARDQAIQIMSRARISADGDKVRLQQRLNEISASQLREFQKLISNISKDIESDAVKEIGEFKQALELETVQSQRVVAEKIQDEYQRMQAELDQAKKEKLALLEVKIKEIIAEVVKQVAGKTIAIEDHEELVIKALEEAKKQHAI